MWDLLDVKKMEEERLQQLFCCRTRDETGGWIRRKGGNGECFQLVCMFSWSTQLVCFQEIPGSILGDWDELGESKARENDFCDL